MKNFFYSLILLASPLLAQTYDLVGTIQDDQTGESIAGADIYTPDSTKIGTSQSTGHFEVTVNNRRKHVIFKHKGYKDLDIDLGDLPNLIDVEISMESDVQELAEVNTYAAKRSHDPSSAQSIEELESLQGMRIDLNDHLRQLHGVAGMNEYANDISVNGSRTEDVTHYLGHSRIPSLRHLDFGFPGNQSVLNPRLLKSITLSDNLAKGPLNQGNASALVYDLQDGDPEALHGDFVLGSVDGEANLNGYWDGRTWLASARFLDPGVLGTLGSKYFTDPKDARLDQSGACTTSSQCPSLTDALTFQSGDFFLGTFLRDSSGGYSRHSLIILSDDYTVKEDISQTLAASEARDLVSGKQGAWLYSYENVSPTQTGDWEWGFSFLDRDYEDAYEDVLPPSGDGFPLPAWYQNGNSTSDNNYPLGDNGQNDKQGILSGQWSPKEKTFGAQTSYGLELEYHDQNRTYLDNPVLSLDHSNIGRQLTQGNALYRLRWNLPKKQSIDASVGAAWGYDALFSKAGSEAMKPIPLASLRYSHPVGDDHEVFVEVAARQLTDFQPTGYDTITAKATQSVEALIGGDGDYGNFFKYAWSGYVRRYFDPALPVPDVYWNYAETRKSDYAQVQGANYTLNWLPSHYVGMGVNGSIIQGSYHMEDNLGSLPWESNRTTDVVTNMRVLPRDDSLLSFIVTYTVSNGRPLYEYRGLWDTAQGGHTTNQRAVFQSSTYPEVSRQRVDVRINIDLKSHWHPLESTRFFFEADNIFQNMDGTWASWLGGSNQRQRGWTRPADANGDLQPVVTRGMGLFIMFGIEGHLKI